MLRSPIDGRLYCYSFVSDGNEEVFFKNCGVATAAVVVVFIMSTAINKLRETMWICYYRFNGE